MLAEARSFRDDTKGAVMLTGLFMSFVLVGALWYVIGVGDAIIFRDRMQEAADSAAFSSAAIHAKGMNFISVINLIMLILVAIHIIFGLIQDATIAICLAAGIGCLWCLAACPRIPGAIENFHSVSSKVKKGLTILSSLETGIAIGAPWMGTAKGYTVGGEYKQGSGNAYLASGGVNVLAIGPSNIFVNGGKGIMVSKAIPVGLPVTGEKYSFLCYLLGKKAIGVLKLIPGLGSISYFSKAMDILGGLAGTALKFRYCNDLGSGDSFFESTKKQLGKAQDELATGSRADEVANEQAKQQAQADKAAGKGDGSYQPVLPGLNGDQSAANKVDTSTNGGKRDEEKSVNGWSPWFDPGFDKGWGDPGVLVTLDSAGNGNQPTRIWAVAMNPKMMDTSEHKVSIGANTKAKAWRSDSEQGSSFVGWFAESEFYYDCEGKWGDEDCDENDHLASFGIRWRARLRKVQLPNLLQVLTDLGSNKLGDVIKEGVNKALEGNPIGEVVAKSKIGAVAIDMLGDQINNLLVKPILEAAKGKLDGFTDGLLPDLNAHH